ncbi:hypothetical protein KTQ54_14880 [Komagataeibacter oboediens]|uniref:hypothetical protein n=1 Tax=Komagataeibacter oboediens TaxID=65958 RepID=UPI001C2C37BC|nr:hypothetical protein [Komagataeibacter oboediens]MBV0889799.1 hypothetical protein [Komagataeibacter oboediens]MCK9818620.1 hypothetical protein [Komagataeibacter oboediens]
MSKRTHLAACAAILSLATLGACASDKQVNLQKAAYDTMSAYHVAATGAEAYLASGNVNATVKSEIKAAAAAALTPLTTLDNAITAGDSLTTTTVSTAESALAGLQSALADAQATTTTGSN